MLADSTPTVPEPDCFFIFLGAGSRWKATPVDNGTKDSGKPQRKSPKLSPSPQWERKPEYTALSLLNRIPAFDLDSASRLLNSLQLLPERESTRTTDTDSNMLMLTGQEQRERGGRGGELVKGEVLHAPCNKQLQHCVVCSQCFLPNASRLCSNFPFAVKHASLKLCVWPTRRNKKFSLSTKGHLQCTLSSSLSLPLS